MKKPKIFPQAERTFHCGACVTASILDYFGETPPPINELYIQLRNEHNWIPTADGLHCEAIQSYFLRREWLCYQNSSGGPVEFDDDKKPVKQHSKESQVLATFNLILNMLNDGYLCGLSYYTAARTQHFALVYDAFIRKGMHWLRVACSSQGYMEVQAVQFLRETGTTQLFIKPMNTELRK